MKGRSTKLFIILLFDMAKKNQHTGFESIDILIQSKPLTNEERIAISKFISDYKLKQQNRKMNKKTK